MTAEGGRVQRCLLLVVEPQRVGTLTQEHASCCNVPLLAAVEEIGREPLVLYIRRGLAVGEASVERAQRAQQLCDGSEICH